VGVVAGQALVTPAHDAVGGALRSDGGVTVWTATGCGHCVLARRHPTNAQLCQKNGWQNLFRTDGTGFASQDDCVSYGAQGGTILTTPPASQSQLDCEANGGQFSTTNDPSGGPGIFQWSCSGYNQATAGNTIAQDCFNDGGIPNTFFDSNGVLRGTSCYK
jgi:hypothetical protein